MSRYKTEKRHGDDKYSWAVVDKRTGRSVVTGCSRRQARYHKDQLESDD